MIDKNEDRIGKFRSLLILVFSFAVISAVIVSQIDTSQFRFVGSILYPVACRSCCYYLFLNLF
uniref:Uncharacterized protein n=1 Tax=Octopus bimaculoides TaxID=37653 RepID=A0A0L8G7U2_OCTBM